MTWEEFKSQIGRLQDQWPRFYSDERVKVIWGWVQRLPAEWWERQVTFQLGHHADTHRGPLAEIESAALRERERQWEHHKTREHSDAVKFFETAEMPDEVKKRLAKVGLYRMPGGECE